jgi:hypothetical protein
MIMTQWVNIFEVDEITNSCFSDLFLQALPLFQENGLSL